MTDTERFAETIDVMFDGRVKTIDDEVSIQLSYSRNDPVGVVAICKLARECGLGVEDRDLDVQHPRQTRSGGGKPGRITERWTFS